MTASEIDAHPVVTSAELAAAIAATDYADAVVTLVGYGRMGSEYFKALRRLGVRRILVCSRSMGRLEGLQGMEGIETVSGGFERLRRRPAPEELGIVATPVPLLEQSVERLVQLGFRRLLIEKPVALSVNRIERLAEVLSQQGVEAMCAYNRVAYPSFHEVKSHIAREGGITSCTYTFTEMIKPDWPQRFSAEELARWGISNSLHVIGMAHGLIGRPASWQGFRAGSLPWHPAGAIFVGAGISEQSIPFAYHADWGSAGRWSVEVHTAVASYRLCPLEQVFRKTGPLADWQPVPITTFATEIKSGIPELVAAMLSPTIRLIVSPLSLREAAALTRYAEALFGYNGEPPHP